MRMQTQSLALPDISHAQLPATYERAKVALTSCVNVDECKDWANKAEALASYAKQSGDQSLRKMADRIQARAIRRCGELLKQVTPSKGGRPKTQAGTLPSSSRTSTARDAGLTGWQQKTAMRVERVPVDVFEAAVESDDPPTVTELAEQGRQRKPTNGVMSKIAASSAKPGFRLATTAIGTLRDFATFCAHNEPALVAAGVSAHERQQVQQHVAIVDAWLDKFVTHLVP